MKLRHLKRLTLLGTASLLLLQSVFAQARIGVVQGTVKDPTGALVPNAEVTITQPVTRYAQKVLTDEQGAFKLVNIPFNTYKVRAEAPGFQPSEQSIDLHSTMPLNIDLTMSVTADEAAVTIKEDSTAVLEPDRT